MTARPAMSRPMATSSGWRGRPRLLGVEDVAQGDQLAGPVRHLDADGRLARDRRQDAHVGRRHGVRDVLGQAGDPGHLDARAELELVAGHRRADPAARPGGSRRRGRPARAPAPRRPRRSGAGPGAASSTPRAATGPAAPTRPGARAATGTATGPPRSRPRARARGRAGCRCRSRRPPPRARAAGRPGRRPRRRWEARAGEVATTSASARADTRAITNGLPLPQRRRRCGRWRRPPVRSARPTVARETPVAIRMATSTTATSSTAAPAVPRPACRGGRRARPDTRRRSCSVCGVGERGVPLASSARPQTPRRPSTVPTARRHGRRRRRRRRRPRRRRAPRSISSTTPAPTRDQREEDAGPAGQERQAGVDAAADGAELLAPQRQRQQDAERDQADGPQVAAPARARMAAAAAAARAGGPAWPASWRRRGRAHASVLPRCLCHHSEVEITA